MSVDEKVTEEIVETLKDGSAGYGQATELVGDDAGAAVTAALRNAKENRDKFLTELKDMAASYGDDVSEDGTTAANLHRSWMKLKDAVTGSDPDTVLSACGAGDEHAIGEYERALDEDISAELKEVLQRQLAQIKQSREQMAALQEG